MHADYENGIVNLASSILKYFGAQNEHNSLEDIDELLKSNYKNVVVLLLDGFGVDALNHHLPENSFFRRHLLKEYSSVFPPTTTAAVTTMESGLTPFEHGWLGWSLYFREVDKVVNAFVNTENDTNKQAADYHVASKFIPYKSIYEKIKEAGIAKAYSVSKFGSNRVNTFDELISEVERLCAASDKKYIYGYWEYPDLFMHKLGCYNRVVTENIRELEEKVEKMCDKLSDTLVIITADHGHCNLEYYILSNYPSLLSMLKRPISIEPRAAAFYIKDEYIDKFPAEFHKNFGDAFLLFSREEVIKNNIFGMGKMHPKFEEFIGDYLAIAIRNKGIVHSYKSIRFASNHAGMTEQEMKIPLIVIDKK